MKVSDLQALSSLELTELAVRLAVDQYFTAKKKMELRYDFKPARLVKSGGAKGWYILFYVWNVQKNDLVRKRKFLPKHLKSTRQKMNFIEDYIEQINILLEQGYHIDKVKAEQEALKQELNKNNPTYKKVLEMYLRYCETHAENSSKEINNKHNIMLTFLKWCHSRYYDVDYLTDVTKPITQEYLDYLLVDKGLQAKTINNTIGRLKNFYNVAIKRDWYTGVNPFNHIEKRKTTYGEKNTAYTDQQIKEIITYCKEHDVYLYYFICFIYYALMRPAEIKRLRVENIDMNRRLIRIYSHQSKVKNHDILPIADTLYEVLLKMEIQKYPPEYFVFSNKQRPGEIQLGRVWTSTHFKVVKEHFNLGPNYSIYGFKHTAVCRWYEHNKDLVRVQRMCRHATIDMTSRYLKSLGLLADEFKIDSLPDL